MNLKREIKDDLRKLVEHVTGIHPGDENFKSCVDFAESNFKYHRYLSPDSHKIERSVDGLCEKFSVHSQPTKSDGLKKVVTNFLDEPGFEGRDYGKTNSHYALLSFLIESANNPTGVGGVYTERTEPSVETEVDTFDWKAYLLEGEELNFMSYASSDSEEDVLWNSSDEEEEGQGDHKTVMWRDMAESGERWPALIEHDEDNNNATALKFSLFDMQEEGDNTVMKQVTDSSPTSLAPPPGLDSGEQIASAVADYNFLEENLVVSYWQGKGREENSRGDHCTSNLAHDWRAYGQKMDPSYTPPSVYVTERQVIRETLWMLSGVTESFIYVYRKDGSYHLNPDVYLSHLTPESLSSFLQPFMTIGEKVAHLHTFFKQIHTQFYGTSTTPCDSSTSSTSPYLFTYQAFADQVWLFMADFKDALCDKERIVIAQKESVTLDKLSNDLRPWLSKVELVYNIYQRGIQQAGDISNARRTLMLLNTLFHVVHETDAADVVESGSKSELVVTMLIHTAKPLLDIANKWILLGDLSDPCHEFVVRSTQKVKSRYFWNASCSSNSATQRKKTSKDEERGSFTNTNMAAAATNKSSSTEPTASDNFYQNESDWLHENCPVFLHAIMKDMVVTGKSMEVLQTLDRWSHVWTNKRPEHLYDHLVKDLNQSFPMKYTDTQPLESPQQINNLQHLGVESDQVIKTILNVKGVRDPLLNLNFANIFPPISTFKGENVRQTSDKRILRLEAPIASSVLIHCERSLQGYGRHMYQAICPKLLEICKKEYRLMDSIHALQRYYLLSCGDIVTDFCYPMFAKIAKGEEWRDWALLEMYLDEALEHSYPADVDRLSMHIDEEFRAKDPLDLTDCLRLKYCIPWPLNCLLQAEDKLNAIFLFLLKIKRAKYSLERLHFTGLAQQVILQSDVTSDLCIQPSDPMDRNTRVHRTQLLRFKFLHFVNCLDNYLMTEILHTSSVELDNRLEEASDLDQILTIHNSYVEVIHQRCLLHTDMDTLRRVILEVLTLAFSCTRLWHQGVDSIRGSMIEEMEVVLSRCVGFLSTFLQKVMKRGNFPHFAPLAASLSSMK